METTTTSEEQTRQIAENLAKSLEGGDVVALFGELGAGKTVFVQGLAKALGIKKHILSPTFVFLRSYPLTINRLFRQKTGSPLTFHHIDLYRAQSPKDLQALGLDEIFGKSSIVVIEWAEKIKKILPKKRIDVAITTLNEKTRRITITPSHVILTPSEARGKDLNNKFSTSSNINKAVEVLKSGGVVIFPTDTVYGIGARYDDKSAIERIYKIKGTRQTQQFPILISDISQVEEVAEVNQKARELMQKHWPGGLTIIMKAKGNDQKLGARMPDSDLVRTLIAAVGVPIIGTSANFHGDPTPKSYEELNQNFAKLADLTVKGKCTLGIESTVVDATVNPIKVLRQGAVNIA